MAARQAGTVWKQSDPLAHLVRERGEHLPGEVWVWPLADLRLAADDALRTGACRHNRAGGHVAAGEGRAAERASLKGHGC